jgi:hypothetical protein
MNSDDLINKQSEFVVDAYKYALEHDLDITKDDDVASILNILDPNQSIQMNADQLLQALVILDKKTRVDISNRNRIN